MLPPEPNSIHPRRTDIVCQHTRSPLTYPIADFINIHAHCTNIYPHTQQLLRQLLHFLDMKQSLESRTITKHLLAGEHARKMTARTWCGDRSVHLFIDILYHVMKGRLGCFVALPLYELEFKNWNRKRGASFCSVYNMAYQNA